MSKQDSETIELVGKHKVPQNVYLFLRFLAAKEIQRKRHHIFQNGGTSPSMRVWKQKLRDETRRRIRLYLFGEKNALEDHIVTRSVDDCNAPVQKMSTTQKKKQKLREQGRNLNSENQKRKRARKAAGSEKQPEPNLFEQAKQLLIDFEKLVADNAKYGNFNEAIAAAIKRGKKPDSRESESDIVHMVEQGQNNHGLTQMPEGPQPGSTPADFRDVVDQVNSETQQLDVLIVFTFDHWSDGLFNTKEKKKEHWWTFSKWPCQLYIEAAAQPSTPLKVQRALWYHGIKVDAKRHPT